MTETLRARCSKALYQRVQFVAETCSGGDVAKWLRYAALAAPRRILK